MPKEFEKENPDSDAPKAGGPEPRGGSPRILLKLSLFPILASIAFVLLYGIAGVGRDTRLRLHSLRNADACDTCHPDRDPGRLARPEPELCIECHKEILFRHRPPHPLGVSVRDLPDPDLLLREGRLTCTTCHDPHGKSPQDGLLRRDKRVLCLTCHPDKEGQHGPLARPHGGFRNRDAVQGSAGRAR